MSYTPELVVTHIQLLDDPKFKSQLLDEELGIGPVGGGAAGTLGMAEGVPPEITEDDKGISIALVAIMSSRR